MKSERPKQGRQAYVKPTGHIDCTLLRGHARICATTVEGIEELEDREPSATDSVANPNVRCRRSLRRYCGAFSIETLRRACSAAARVLPGDLHARPAIIVRLRPSGSSHSRARPPLRHTRMGVGSLVCARAHVRTDTSAERTARRALSVVRWRAQEGAPSRASANEGAPDSLGCALAVQNNRRGGCACESTMRGSARGRGAPCRGGGARLRW